MELAELYGTQDDVSTDAILLGTTGASDGELGALQHVVYSFTGSNTVSAGDTFTLPTAGDTKVVRLAWEAEPGVGGSAYVFQVSGKQIAWGAGAGTTGYLHLWVTG